MITDKKVQIGEKNMVNLHLLIHSDVEEVSSLRLVLIQIGSLARVVSLSNDSWKMSSKLIICSLLLDINTLGIW